MNKQSSAIAAAKSLTRMIAKEIPKSFEKGIVSGNVNRAYRGYKKMHADSGFDSLVAFLPMKGAEKVWGKEKVRDAAWKYVGKPSLTADIAAGSAIAKVPGLKGLFTISEKIPVGDKGLYQEIKRHSALAPLTKAKGIIAPIATAVALEKGIDKGVQYVKDKRQLDNMSKKAMEEKDLLTKAASIMHSLHEDNKMHEKKAAAMQLLYKQAELGLADLPRSYNELQEKLGQLIKEDLSVYEKALDLAHGHMKIGELQDSFEEKSTKSPEAKFQATFLNHLD